MSADRPFETTRWTLVVAAGGPVTAQSREALARLCEIYWYPLYAYVRRWGYPLDEAQDLTQAFFTRLIERNVVAEANPARGRFRSFLLASLKHFLANEYDRATALKRGGGRPVLSLEFEAAESRYRLEPSDLETPDKVFERGWAAALLACVMGRLAAEQAHAGKRDLFERLRPALAEGAAEASYAEIGAAFGMSEGAIKVAVHRLRHRFGELLREEIAETVADPVEVDEEIRYLLTALRS